MRAAFSFRPPLQELRVRGEIRTNADYVCDLIQTPDFVNNGHHTGWLDSRIAAQVRHEAGRGGF